MLLPMAGDMMMGPPPQGVIDKKWAWSLLIVLLGLCFILRFISLDVPGALLSGLMLCFVVLMTRDGMQEIVRYALVFAVLCFLNFFFDILPLLTELGGRVQSKTVPTYETDPSGHRVTIFKVSMTSRPFFDASQGFVYNIQSFVMILSPVAMALGCYLAVSAHIEVQRAWPLFEEDREDLVGLLPRGRPPRDESVAHEDRPSPAVDSAGDTSRRSPNEQGFVPFVGPSFKLYDNREV